MLRHRLQCSQVWGGVRDEDVDACSAALHVSLFSTACDGDGKGGGKGGDIYYLSVCDSDELTRVVLADVVGHGQSAARVSEWLYDAMHRRMNELEGNEILADLNALATGRGMEALTTAAVAGFYRTESTLYVSYAGHHPALTCRAGESSWRAIEPVETDSGVEVDDAINLPLGVIEATRYVQQHIALAAGDRIALYTDGLIEASSPAGDLFGVDRLLGTLDAHARRELHEIKSAVIDSVRRHTGGPLAHDDVTLLLAEVR
jgi:phosphoserine phosphatase RsbU/P